MDEYISKESMLKNLTSDLEHHSDEDDPCTHLVMRRVIKYVEAFPAADVQTIKRGRWENEYLDDDDVWWADCTNCKNETHSRFGRVSIYAYCPNCGADMRCE